MTDFEKRLISSICNCSTDEIIKLESLKSMTNANTLFSVRGTKFVLRHPGYGTDQLVDRKQELSTYYHLKGLDISDEPIYYDVTTGYKITYFIEDAHTCDVQNHKDMKKCMTFLRYIHNRGLIVPHEIDMLKMLLNYQALMGHIPYMDYTKTYRSIIQDIKYMDETTSKKVLVHFDPNPQNFLILNKDCYKSVTLLDWEYAGMCDPLVDIAMFAIYSNFNKQQIEELAYMYNPNMTKTDLLRVYTYCAIAGLIWSNWANYKCRCGDEFYEYANEQYEYAKEFTGAWKWKT